MDGYRKTAVIADVHGCPKELTALLVQLELEKGKDRLIFLGDAIDRGYDSEGVIRILIELRDTFGEDLIWLLGNHEDALMQRSRKRSFFKKDPLPLSGYCRMFSELPLLYETDRCTFVHAGYDGDPENRKCLLEDRSVLNGDRNYSGKLYIAGHSPFFRDSIKPFDQPVYIDAKGKPHDVYDGMRLPETGALFIDTGCVYKNRLTALIIDGQDVIHLSTVGFIGV